MDLDKIISGIKVDGVNCYAEAEEESWSEVPFFIDTGCPGLNYAIAGYKFGKKGGIPIGKVVEIMGMESCLKSTLLDHAIRNTLNMGGAVFLADAETAHTAERLSLIGTQSLENLRFIQKPKAMEKLEHEETKKKGSKKGSGKDLPLVLEEFFEIADATVTKFRKHVDAEVPVLIALDSLAAIQTRAQAETEDPTMKDRLDKSSVMEYHLKDLATLVTVNQAALVIVNQMRTKPGVVFGKATYSPGGDSKNFYFSVRIEMGHAKKIKAEDDILDSDEERIGSDVVGLSGSFDIIKNKIAAPYRKGTFPFYFDERGIWYEQSLARVIIEREKWKFNDDFELDKTTYVWKGEKLGVGEKGLTKAFLEDPSLMMEIEEGLFG